MIRGLVVFGVMLATSLAHAERPVALIDEIVVAGGVDSDQARRFVISVVARAGLEARFLSGEEDPCGDDPACLARRARRERARIAVRFTITEVAGDVIVAILAVQEQRTRRELAESVDLQRSEDLLVDTLRGLAPATRSSRRVVAWTFAGAGVVLGIAGGVATWRAHDLEARFFARHVDANGDVFGISPQGARAAEREARRWSMIGAAGLGLGAIAGVTATILFVRRDSGEPQPAGIALAMELP
jgi:hypothetical protein